MSNCSDFCFEAKFVNVGQHTDGHSSCNLQQSPVYVWSGASPGRHTDGCTHDTPDTGMASYEDSTGVSEAEFGHSRSHTESFSPKRLVLNRSKTGHDGSTARGARSFWSCRAVTPGFRNFSRCARDSWCADLFGNNPSHCAARRWTMQSHRCLHPPGLEVVPQGGKRRVHFCTRRTRKLACFCSPLTQSLNLQHVTLYQARHSGASIDRAREREAPPLMQVAQAVAHGPERPELREKLSSGS